MIPAGYMAKRILNRPQLVFENTAIQVLESTDIVDIYSVSGCISKDFADYINFWKHNGYWFFDSPQIIQKIAKEHSIELSGTKLFYYEMYNLEFHEDNEWKSFEPEASFTTDIKKPNLKDLEGYDIVTFSCGNSPECSPLSCNCLANTIPVNKHCLLSSFDNAHQLLENGEFQNSEPGPYRILAVYSVS
ncbi:MAG: hypothetical protein ACR2KZ_04465 [Segetibacter sp.]